MKSNTDISLKGSELRKQSLAQAPCSFFSTHLPRSWKHLARPYLRSLVFPLASLSHRHGSLLHLTNWLYLAPSPSLVTLPCTNKLRDMDLQSGWETKGDSCKMSVTWNSLLLLEEKTGTQPLVVGKAWSCFGDWNDLFFVGSQVFKDHSGLKLLGIRLIPPKEQES